MEYGIVCRRNADVEDVIQRLESFEMWIWRMLMKISWTEHRSNQEVLDMVDEKRSLMNTIRQRQKNWLGHVLRSESFLRSLRRQNGRDKNS